MIRAATLDDLPTLAQWMVVLKAKTGWSLYPQPGYNYDTLLTFLTLQLMDPQSVCWVWDPGAGPRAFCGGSLQRFVLPPHMPCVLEWGWAGTPKGAVHCWRALCTWGQEHGAELAGRVQAAPGSTPTTIRESIIWSVL